MSGHTVETDWEEIGRLMNALEFYNRIEPDLKRIMFVVQDNPEIVGVEPGGSILKAVADHLEELAETDEADPVSVEAQNGPYPTPREISQLPDHIRSYIHDLETRCDPAGDLRRLDAERQKRRELEAEGEELREALREIVRKSYEMSGQDFYNYAAQKAASALGETDDTKMRRYPSPGEISRLPDHIREYIHELENQCDPTYPKREISHVD